MGVSKRALLEDYYPDELGPLVAAWNRLHGAHDADAEPCAPMAFFGGDGEVVGE